MPTIYYRRAHAEGRHKGNPSPSCTLCTQERQVGEMREAHARGDHAKLQRKKCQDCKAARAAQWKLSPAPRVPAQEVAPR
jgi:hypothetical protein